MPSKKSRKAPKEKPNKDQAEEHSNDDSIFESGGEELSRSKRVRAPKVKRDYNESNEDFHEEEETVTKNKGKTIPEEDEELETDEHPKLKKATRSIVPKTVSASGHSSATSVNNPEFTILEYLEKQYRPYSVNDIVQNLHGSINKATATKTLDSLAKKGKILCKVLGKMTIYVANKVELTEDMKAIDMDKNMSDLNEELKELELEVSQIQEKYQSLVRLPSDDKLDSDYNSLIVEIKELERRILESSSKPSLSPESVKKVQLISEEVTKESEKRIKMYKNFMKYISEFTDPRTLANDLGLEEVI